MSLKTDIASPALPLEEVKSARMHWALAVVLAILPAVGLGRAVSSYTAHGSDVALTTVALFIGAGWHIWRFLGVAPSSEPASGFWVGLALLSIAAWQLAWVSAEDFWFFRLGMVVAAAGWLLVVWDWSGLVHGWRVLAASGIWAVWCDGKLSAGSDGFAQWLSEVSARVAGMVLLLAGRSPVVDGVVLRDHGASVSVGRPCTAIPLVMLLWVLLILAGLLMRQRWTTLLAIGLASAAAAFAISIVRIIVLLSVVRDPQRFAYWHFGPGGAWFSTAGIIVLGWLLWRAGGRLPARTEPYSSREHVERRLARALPAVLACGIAGMVVSGPSPEDPLAGVPALAGAQLVSQSTEVPGAWTSNGFAERHRVTYGPGTGVYRLDMVAAFVPVMLTGDPRAVPDGARMASLDRPWMPRGVPGIGEVWEAREGGRVTWLATVRPDGVVVATRASWRSWVRAGARSPARWFAWLCHRAALRDKRAYWMALSYSGNDEEADQVLSRALSAWTGGLRWSR